MGLGKCIKINSSHHSRQNTVWDGLNPICPPASSVPFYAENPIKILLKKASRLIN